MADLTRQPINLVDRTPEFTAVAKTMMIPGGVHTGFALFGNSLTTIHGEVIHLLPAGVGRFDQALFFEPAQGRIDRAGAGDPASTRAFVECRDHVIAMARLFIQEGQQGSGDGAAGSPTALTTTSSTATMMSVAVTVPVRTIPIATVTTVTVTVATMTVAVPVIAVSVRPIAVTAAAMAGTVGAIAITAATVMAITVAAVPMSVTLAVAMLSTTVTVVMSVFVFVIVIHDKFSFCHVSPTDSQRYVVT